MKKFLAIIILCIFWNVNAYAKCSDDLDRSWKYGPDNYFMIYTFKNKTNKSIIITRVGLKDKSGNIMAEQKVYVRKCADCAVPVGDDDLYINPYGVNKILISVNHLNLEVAGDLFELGKSRFSIGYSLDLSKSWFCKLILEIVSSMASGN